MRIIILKADEALPTYDGRLTKREKEVLALVLSDMPRKQIGPKLGVTHHLVNVYMARLRLKYHVRTNIGLLVKVLKPEVFKVDPPPAKDDLVLNTASHTIRFNGKTVCLGSVGYGIVEHLARHWGKGPQSHKPIYCAAYGLRNHSKSYVEQLTSMITWVRRRLWPLGLEIANTFGAGYELVLLSESRKSYRGHPSTLTKGRKA